MSIWHNAHGMFVPFVVAYLIYDSLRRDSTDTPDSSALGFAFLAPGVLFLTLDSVAGTQLVAAFGMILCLPGFSLLFLGMRRTRLLLFPLLLAFFMLPIPAVAIEPIHWVLRQITAAGAKELISFLGVPVLRNSTTLSLSAGDLEIAEACSGFSALYAAVTMSMVIAYLRPAGRGRYLPLLAAVPFAIFSNVLRCASLGLLVHSQGMSILETPLHVISGFVSFGITMLALFWLGSR
jgi:exosortase